MCEFKDCRRQILTVKYTGPKPLPNKGHVLQPFKGILNATWYVVL